VNQPEHLTTLDYASNLAPKPPPKALAWVSRGSSILASGVGLLCLLSYAVSRSDRFVIFGFYWLYIGAMLCAVSFITACVWSGIAIARRFPASSTRMQVLWLILLSLSPLPVAVFCFFAGVALVDWQHGI